ncbi:MAG: hypothetical protein RIF41_21085 [Polyangiaceae bacterium]
MTVITNPNPYVDSGPWGIVEIGGLPLPGIVISIDGAEKPEEWNVQKATAKSGAATVWKGTKLAESIKIELALPTLESFDRYYQMRDVLRPKLGTKPPTYSIVNPAINFNGITRVSCRNIGMPKWVESTNYWKGLVEVLEYSPPKPANTGVAGSSGVDVGDVLSKGAKSVDPNADLNEQLKELTAEAKKY